MDDAPFGRTCREALVWASSLLFQHRLNPKVAEWALLKLLDVDKTRFLTLLDTPLTLSQRLSFQEQMERVLAGEPYQYVLGSTQFFGREFDVNPAVLIPRPETELLVEEVLRTVKALPWFQKSQSERALKAVDVGTGSGAIAITLALELGPTWQVYGVDISPEALHVARQNARRLNAQVILEESDWLKALLDRGEELDLIVSNPPYVSPNEKALLDATVVEHEPHVALFAEKDGLASYEQILAQARFLLKRPGLIAFEVGQGQAEAVAQLIRENFAGVRCQIKPDWQGIQRLVLAQIEA